jgi:ELWxxDGT repeat protein
MHIHQRFAATFIAVCALFFSLIPPSAQASQTGPQMLGDFRMGTLSSNPYGFLPFGDKLLFTADGPDSEEQPWITDGTQQGTYLLKDIAPGSYSSTSFGAVSNGVAYFSAASPDFGQELWKTDGTPQGTSMVADINPGLGSSYPMNMIANHDLVYFQAAPTGQYSEKAKLFFTNGAAITAVQGSDSIVSIEASIVFQQSVYFLASSDHSSLDLWRTTSDGLSVEKIKRVSDQNINLNYPFNEQKFAIFEDHLYFTFSDTTGQNLLWRSDGTLDGTFLVKVFHSSQVPVNSLTVIGDWLYFNAADNLPGCELWQSDGTANGTTVVTHKSNLSTYESCLGGPVQIGTNLFVSISTAAAGKELWKIDLTTREAALVIDIAPGSTASYPDSLIELNGVLFFRANETGDPDSADLWRTEGTPQTTYELKHCHMPENWWYMVGCGFVTKWKGGLLFSGFDPQHGQELWTSDGTPQGTQFSIDVNTAQVGSNFDGGVFYKNNLYFRLNTDNIQDTLWRSDGTPAGTQKFADISPWGQGSGISRRTGYEPAGELGGILYFAASDLTHGREMWRTDGTPEGTWMVKDIDQSAGRSTIDYLVTAGDYYYYDYSSEVSGLSGIYRSDGTEAGTTNVAGCADGLLEVNGQVIFSCDNYTYYGPYSEYLNTTIYHLTFAGSPEAIATLNQNSPFYWHVKVNNLIFFTAGYCYSSAPLYQTDGATIQTINLVGDSNSHGYFDLLTPVGSNLFFVTKRNGSNILWKLEAGSRDAGIVKDLPGVPLQMVALNGKVFLRLQNGAGVDELWLSDGTAVGTRAVCPSCAITKLGGLTAWQGLLYFSATDALHGAELWQTDGTSDGTRLYMDLRPGPQSSNPAYLTAQGDKLFFSADDGIHGSEPWVMRVFDHAAYLPLVQR